MKRLSPHLGDLGVKRSVKVKDKKSNVERRLNLRSRTTNQREHVLSWNMCSCFQQQVKIKISVF